MSHFCTKLCVVAGCWRLPGHYQTAAVSAVYRESAFNTFAYIGVAVRRTSSGHKNMSEIILYVPRGGTKINLQCLVTLFLHCMNNNYR